MLASGRPILATGTPDSEVAGYVAHCGALVAPGDAGGLARAIRVLALDKEERVRLGIEARKHAMRALRHSVILSDFEAELNYRLAPAVREAQALRSMNGSG
jgi:glycosyltransferase involved in cell wall biosynthesis